ncbi:MAG: integration host factor subunit alpha [Rhodobacteraceae bacterium]|nr:integration host factor subunit alpha [Paracoccaceae bacterium]
MAEKTLARAQLRDAIVHEVGLSRSESLQLVESILDYMIEALIQGESVKISSFGTFKVLQKRARMGRNPRTGEEAPIAPRRVLSFYPSHKVKARVAQGHTDK